MFVWNTRTGIPYPHFANCRDVSGGCLVPASFVNHDGSLLLALSPMSGPSPPFGPAVDVR